MKKINTYIDYGKLVIALLLFLLGSEPTKTALIFLMAAFVVTVGIELYLIHYRKILALRYERYLKSLEKAVRQTMAETEDAA